ncbi:hypothetical protein K502DRAFT_342000 [Neoconidiobolus thromboides FSU 785]|nr:hypothetical protein K502DRAFT_342000 [Neoconidiobolus thromboides FSU 785]
MVNKVLSLRILNFVTGLAAIIVNIITTLVPLNGSRLSDMDNNVNKIMPAGTAFSIWAVIYIFKLLFMSYQLFPRTYDLKYINYGITPYFSLLALLNITWLLTQAYLKDELYIVQLIVIYVMFVVLLVMYSMTFKYIKNDLILSTESNNNFYLNYWLGRVWLSIYFAWITGAICVDSFSVFSDLPTTTYISSTITLCLLAILTIVIVFINRDVAFSLTFIWTSAWIIVNHKNVEEGYPLFITACVVIAVVSIVTVVAFILNLKFVFNRRKISETEIEKLNNEIS